MLDHLYDGEIFKLFWINGLTSNNSQTMAFSWILVATILISIAFTIFQIYEAHTKGGVYKIGSLIMQTFWLVTFGFLFVLSMPQQFVQIFHML